MCIITGTTSRVLIILLLIRFKRKAAVRVKKKAAMAMEAFFNPPDISNRVLMQQMDFVIRQLTTLEAEVERLRQVEDDVVNLEVELRNAKEAVAILKRGRITRIETAINVLGQKIEPPIYASGDRVFITNKGIKPKRRLRRSERDAWRARVYRATITRVVPAKGKQPVKMVVVTDHGLRTWRAEKNLKRITDDIVTSKTTVSSRLTSNPYYA